MKVCMAEMQTSKGDGCNAVSAYVKQCRQNDVMLWEPKTCGECPILTQLKYLFSLWVRVMMFNSTFNNISAI
jgi:hypothetical protein